MVRIPRTEAQVGFTPSTQPTWSGESAAAPGKALQQLGNAIGSVGEAFQGEINKQDEFNANLKLLNWDNDETTRQIKSQADFNRDNPDGYATQEHTARTERFNAVLSSMPNEKMKQKAQIHFASRGHNFYEGDQRFEFGKRNDMIYRNLDAAITGEFNDQALNSPEDLQGKLKDKLDGIEAMISKYPGSPAHKEALRKSAADMAFKTIQSTLTAADKIDDIDKVTKSILQQYGAGQVPGPQSQAPSDARTFLRGKLAKGYESRTSDIDNLHPAMQDRLAAFTKAAQDAGYDISIVSGHRSEERQAKLWKDAVAKYGSETAARSFVAPPGGSTHQSGEAVDLQYGDRAPGLGGNKTAAVDWAHKNAAKFGLNFPLGHEDWHIEPVEARAGGKRFGGQYDASKKYWQQQGPAVGQISVAGDGTIDPVSFAKVMEAKVAASDLNGNVPSWGPQFGIKTGSPREWARFFTMVQQQESGHRLASVNSDGSLQRFPTTPGGEKSFGPGQFNVGEYGLKTWADVNNPDKVADAYIKVAQAGNIQKYFGSVQRPNETLQHAQWYETNVASKLGATDKPQQSAPKLSGGILTSLDDSPTPDEIKRSGAAVVDFDLSKPGAQVALKAAKDQGIKVAAYHEGAGGGASWGEGSRDLKSPAELSKLAADAKKLSDQGADYLHLDNLHDMKAADLAKVAQTVKDATGGRMSVIAKNNPVAWLEVIKANPDLKPAYAVIEHGTKDKVQIEAARQLNDLGVPVHFVEFGDPGTDKATGQKRTDPISTPDEAKAFAKSNPWIGSVVHMKSQDNYNGREVAGGQSFRPENTIPGPNANKVADASGNVIPMPRAQTTHSQFSEVLQKHLPAIERQAELAREKWAKEQQGLIKEIIDLADKGYSADQLMAKLDESVGKKPELSKKYGLDMASDGVRQAVDTTMQIRQLRPQELEQGVKALDDQLKSGNATKELVAKKERYEKLLGEMRKGINEDPISWANRTDVAKYQPLDWTKPESLKARVDLARTIADYYGQLPQFFTKDEREALKDTLKMGGKPMLEKLGLLQAAFGPDMLSAMGEISKQAPEAATIGWMMVKGLNAQTIEDAAIGMERQAKRALGEKGMPEIKKADGRQALLDAAGLAFSRMPASEGAVVETVNAIMDARAQKRGLKEVSPADWKAALKEVIGESTDKAGNTYGGFQSFGGSHKVVLPQNLKNNEGFTSGNTFGQVLDTLRYEDIVDPMGKGPASGSGTPLSIGTIRKATPISVGDGRYLLALGDPNGSDPQLIQDGTGKNYVLDLNMLEDKIKSRRPDLYKGYVQPEPATGPEIERPPVTGN